MKKIIRFIVKIIMVALLYALVIFLIHSYLNRVETKECVEWNNTENYVYSSWQIDQCSTLGVKLESHFTN